MVRRFNVYLISLYLRGKHLYCSRTLGKEVEVYIIQKEGNISFPTVILKCNFHAFITFYYKIGTLMQKLSKL